MKESQVDPWVGKILWRREWQSTPVLLPGQSHEQRSLAGHSPWGRNESDMTERLTVYIVLSAYRYHPENGHRLHQPASPGAPMVV